jgi:hypothetical protein
MRHSRATVGHEKATCGHDQVQRLIGGKEPREREVGLKKVLPVPRPRWLRYGALRRVEVATPGAGKVD